MNKKTLLFSILFFLSSHGVIRLSDASQITRAYIKDLPGNSTQLAYIPQAQHITMVVHIHKEAGDIINNGNLTSTNTATQDNQIAASSDSSSNSKSDLESSVELGVHKSILDKNTDGYDLNLLSLLLDNKLKAFGVAACSCYAWATYRIHCANKILSSHDSWCNWKSVVPLQHLALTQYQDLICQLNMDLQKKHYLKHGQCPQKYLCQLFFGDLQEEMDCLKIYLNIIKTTKTVHCSRLFFFSYDQSTIEEKLARLGFVFDLFIRMQAEGSR